MLQGRLVVKPQNAESEEYNRKVAEDLEQRIARDQETLDALNRKLHSDYADYIEAIDAMRQLREQRAELQEECDRFLVRYQQKHSVVAIPISLSNDEFQRRVSTLEDAATRDSMMRLRDSWIGYDRDLKKFDEKNEIRKYSEKCAFIVKSDNDLVNLINDIAAKKFLISENKKLLAQQAKEQETVKDLEKGLDATSFVVSVVNASRKFLDYTGQTIAKFSEIMPIMSMTMAGIYTLWESIKTINSKVDSIESKALKIGIEVGLIALGIASFFMAPIAYAFVTVLSVSIGFVKDFVYPWLVTLADLDDHKQAFLESKEYKDLKALKGEDYLNKDVNEIEADAKAAREKVSLGADYIRGRLATVNEEINRFLADDYKARIANLSLPEQSDALVARQAEGLALHARRSQLQKELRALQRESLILSRYAEKKKQYDKEHKVLAEKEEKKRYEMLLGAASILGTVFVVIPFPPLQIAGVAILLAVTVISVVRKYDLLTKAKKFFESVGDYLFGKPEVVEPKERLDAELGLKETLTSRRDGIELGNITKNWSPTLRIPRVNSREPLVSSPRSGGSDDSSPLAALPPSPPSPAFASDSESSTMLAKKGGHADHKYSGTSSAGSGVQSIMSRHSAVVGSYRGGIFVPAPLAPLSPIAESKTEDLPATPVSPVPVVRESAVPVPQSLVEKAAIPVVATATASGSASIKSPGAKMSGLTSMALRGLLTPPSPTSKQASRKSVDWSQPSSPDLFGDDVSEHAPLIRRSSSH